MVGFAMVLGGGMKGYGDNVLEQAKALREERIAERAAERQRQFVHDEAAIGRTFEAEEGAKNRALKGDGSDYKVVNDRLVKTGPAGVEDVTPATPEGASTVNFDDVSGLRKEIQQLPSYKNLSQAAPIYKSMVETAGRNTRASDLNIVYGLGKIMDPTSVVREGEMVMVKNTASLPDWLNGAINSVNGGAGLTPETRQAIMAEAYGRVKGYSDEFKRDSDQYRGIVTRNKINPADVIPEFGEASPWEAGGPARPTTDSEFNALPSGALFIDPDDGKTYRKP